MMELYLGKYHMYNHEDDRSDHEKVLSYFKCLFGDELSLDDVMDYDKLDEYCQHNEYSRDFVITVISDYCSSE